MNEIIELKLNAYKQYCIACDAEAQGKELDIDASERYEAYKYLNNLENDI